MFSRRDVIAGTLLATAMVGLFTLGSPGLALIVTFVPGTIAAWLTFLHLTRTARPIPSPERILPVFGIALAIQFLHFAEEFTTGFQTQFGPLYGGSVIPDSIFVGFNMAAYAVFLLASGGVAFMRQRALLIPVLFFAIYGVVGNAVSHMTWTILKGAYFPGFATSLAYWVLGPILLSRIGLERREIWILIVVFAVVLITTTVTALNFDVLRAG